MAPPKVSIGFIHCKRESELCYSPLVPNYELFTENVNNSNVNPSDRILVGGQVASRAFSKSSATSGSIKYQLPPSGLGLTVIGRTRPSLNRYRPGHANTPARPMRPFGMS